ncbi:MAG: ABC transporter substrate-binding protein [Dehalococcoidia bacterium]
MMRTRGLLRLVGIIGTALVVLGLLLSMACTAPPGEPTGTETAAPEDQPLKFGAEICWTGVAAEKCQPMGDGLLDSIKYINEEKGGVQGHPIEVVDRDSGYDTSKMATIARGWIDEGMPLFTTCSSKMMESAMAISNRAGMPGICDFCSTKCVHPPKHVYAQSPGYGDETLAFLEHFKNNIWDGDGTIKLALHILNNPTGYGAQMACRAKAEEMGYEVVAVEEHKAETMSEMETLTRIEEENPDVLFISSTPAPTSVILKNAKDQGIDIPIGMAHASFVPDVLMEMAGADVLEGIYGVYPTAAFDTPESDAPGIAKVKEYSSEYSKEYYESESLDYLCHWAHGLVVYKIFETAMENASYEEIMEGPKEQRWKTIEEEGIKKLETYDMEGLTGPLTAPTEKDHRLIKAVKLYQIQEGEKVLLAEPEAPLVPYEEYEWFE